MKAATVIAMILLLGHLLQLAPEKSPDAELGACPVVQQALNDYRQIKLGMTRRQVERRF